MKADLEHERDAARQWAKESHDENQRLIKEMLIPAKVCRAWAPCRESGTCLQGFDGRSEECEIFQATGELVAGLVRELDAVELERDRLESERAEALQRAATAEEELTRVMRLFEDLTPGGSEFVRSPVNVAAYLKARIDTSFELALERNQLRAKGETAEKTAEQWRNVAAIFMWEGYEEGARAYDSLLDAIRIALQKAEAGS